MVYHISWLKSALEKCSDSSVDGDMTIDKFIKKYMSEELKISEIIKTIKYRIHSNRGD